MVYGLYVSYDKVTNLYSMPWYAVDNNDAIRCFYLQAVKNPFCKDVSLYHIGNYCVQRGYVECINDESTNEHVREFICDYDYDDCKRILHLGEVEENEKKS